MESRVHQRPDSAQALRERYGIGISVTLPSGATVTCRRLDLHDMVFRRMLPMPILQQMIESVQSGEGAISIEQAIANSPSSVDFLDQCVCASLQSPRAVMTEAEATDDAIWVGHMPLSDRTAILEATTATRRQEAPQTDVVAEFSGEPDGGAAGSDGAPVPPAPVAVFVDGR